VPPRQSPSELPGPSRGEINEPCPSGKLILHPEVDSSSGSELNPFIEEYDGETDYAQGERIMKLLPHLELSQ